jgi:uncharacterized protein YprB with RNaseH-like and TPR domain
MIRNSFIFLDKVSRKTEDYLWSLGIRSWDDFLKAERIIGISDARKRHYDRKLLEARGCLYGLDSSYFAKRLPGSEAWRLYAFFREEAAFLDIETSGVSMDSYVTMVGVFDGIETRQFVRGINLDGKSLKEELSRYKLLVTFNGSTFDLPMIARKFPGVIPAVPHWDLRHSCARVGLRGGLKQIERELGIKRSNPIIERMYGGDAITMWRMFRNSGDDYYLKLLIEYNEEDCINLKPIANRIYGKLAAETARRAEPENIAPSSLIPSSPSA